MSKQGFIYVLSCEGGYWYVGYSEDTQTRIASHFLGSGAKWTQLHKPARIEEVRPGDRHLETLITISLMCRYGWEKVRGGSYVNVEMAGPPACIATAQRYVDKPRGRKEEEE